MKFLKKPYELTFSCLPSFRHVYELFRPTYAGKFLPPWYKNLSSTKTIQNEFQLNVPWPTIKTCYGISQTLVNGIIVPLWSDFILEINSDGKYRYQFADTTSEIMAQPESKIFTNKHVFKIPCPWYASSNVDLNMHSMHPLYHLKQDAAYTTLNGFLTLTKKIPIPLNTFLVFPVKQEVQRYEFVAGTPLLHLISTEGKPFKLNYKVGDEFTGIQNRCFFAKSYEKMRRNIQP